MGKEERWALQGELWELVLELRAYVNRVDIEFVDVRELAATIGDLSTAIDVKVLKIGEQEV